jgi:hypothetical protein
MKTRITRKTSSNFDVKAVEQDDSAALYGIVRMSRREYPHMVRGICAEFVTDEPRRSIYLNRQPLFFYGDGEDLDRNYRREVPPGLNSKQFEDKPFAPTTYSKFRGLSKPGYLLIPLERMRFGTQQNGLVERVLSEAEDVLPRLVAGLVRVEIVMDNPESMRFFGHVLAPFPKYLKDRMQDRGAFYRNASGRQRPLTEECFTPDLVFVSGGLPDLGKNR